MVIANDALQRLRSGNKRFIDGELNRATDFDKVRSFHMPEGNKPFAVIVSCSDFQIPAEMVFDQCLGDLFIIRVAGNIVAPSLVASVEFAVNYYGIQLVVVLGHSQCSAVAATLDELTPQAQAVAVGSYSIVERVRPSVVTLVEANLKTDRDSLLEQAIRANVLASSDQLRHNSELLERLVQEGKLQVIGAEYLPQAGEVEFFDVPN